MENFSETDTPEFRTTLKNGFVILADLLRDRLMEILPEVPSTLQWPAGNQVEYHEAYFQKFQDQHPMTAEECLVLFVAMAPTFHPELLELLNRPEVFRHISPGLVGGQVRDPARTFVPTCRTVAFILNKQDRNFFRILDKDHFFFHENIMRLGPIPEGLSLLDATLGLSDEYTHLLTTGSFEPRFGDHFPAKKISTSQSWDDLVLRDSTLRQINLIRAWIRHEQTIKNNPALLKKIRRGYRALFYGPSGTGKTLTVSLLGQSFNMPVYRVELSSLVSKYIGETEKNMEKVFNMAESRGWILFFDEAESLFGKRSSGGTANDRYSNQEIGYLLQRIEDYDGILILASNKLFDIDEAFTRRFPSFIEFPEPNEEERRILWKKLFDPGMGIPLTDEVDFEKIIHLKITGGMLVNVLRYCVLVALERIEPHITQADIVEALKYEYQKEKRQWVEVPEKSNGVRVQVKSSAV